MFVRLNSTNQFQSNDWHAAKNIPYAGTNAVPLSPENIHLINKFNDCYVAHQSCICIFIEMPDLSDPKRSFIFTFFPINSSFNSGKMGGKSVIISGIKDNSGVSDTLRLLGNLISIVNGLDTVPDIDTGLTILDVNLL